MNQMAITCGVNIKTIKRDIEKLKVDKVIIRQGGRKDGYWELIEKYTN